VKYAWIRSQSDEFEITRMCRLLEVSRTGFSQWRKREPSLRERANASLDAEVAQLHAASGRSYGRNRIVQDLKNRGQRVGHERVRQSLRRQYLRPAYKRPYRVTTDSDHQKPIAQNILDRRFEGWQPNQAWVGDITYIATGEGWLYLAVVLDLASRRIVGWSMNDRMPARLVCDALSMAFWQRKPEAGLIMHTDRGSQYASDQYRQLTEDYEMVRSMSRRANCWDNSVVESFFKTLKVERIYQVSYVTKAQARLDIVDWIEGIYNRSRLHSSIGYRTPVDAEHRVMAA
jgi:putative transposase